MKTYRQMSQNQETYVEFIRKNPGASIAQINRACKVNPLAGHKWVYDGVHRLARKGVISINYTAGKTSCFIA